MSNFNPRRKPQTSKWGPGLIAVVMFVAASVASWRIDHELRETESLAAASTMAVKGDALMVALQHSVVVSGPETWPKLLDQLRASTPGLAAITLEPREEGLPSIAVQPTAAIAHRLPRELWLGERGHGPPDYRVELAFATPESVRATGRGVAMVLVWIFSAAAWFAGFRMFERRRRAMEQVDALLDCLVSGRDPGTLELPEGSDETARFGRKMLMAFQLVDDTGLGTVAANDSGISALGTALGPAGRTARAA